MNSLSFVIPVYNNAKSIGELFDRLQNALTEITEKYEIIFIDDGSVDNSWGIIQSICSKDERVVGIRFSRNFGQHPAINAGMRRATGEITVLMDADLQDRPEELANLLSPFEFENSDDLEVVYTQFQMESGGKSRLTSRIFGRVFTKLSGNKHPSNVGTYRAFTSKVRRALLEYPEAGAVYGPLMVQMGFNQTFVQVSRSEAIGRRTSYTFGKRVALALSALIAYSAFLHWIVTLTGIALTTISAFYLSLMTIQYVVGDRTLMNGQVLLIGITVLLSGVSLMCIGILTAYITRIYQEVLARPRFHISHELGSGLIDGSTT
jgi:polyisoprenyl-phosphate glycosyltransferase